MKSNALFRFLTLIVLCFSFLAGPVHPVKAATCTWNASVNSDWNTAGNWSDCGGTIPGSGDSVTIPGVGVGPIIPQITGVEVASLTIQAGGQLTLSAGSVLNTPLLNNHGTLVVNASSLVYLNSSGVFNNYGTVTKTGGDDFGIYQVFNNYGTVDISQGNIILNRGGTHTGTFQGNAGTYLFLGLDAVTQTYDFESDSLITVPNFFLRGGTVNFEGTYWPPASGSGLTVQPSYEPCTLTIASEAVVVSMPEKTTVANWGKLVLEARSGPVGFPSLDIHPGGEVQNLGEMTVQNAFNWRGGKISGAGTTNVSIGATIFITMGTLPRELDGQALINSGVANWTAGTITLANSAEIDNQGTFNATATTSMNGEYNGSFINHGSFIKNGSGTTTTIDVDFTNHESIEVFAGTLAFTSGFTSGDGTVVDLGSGFLGTGDTFSLASGASLTGSGTLNGGLNNDGEVSPGASPGKITVSEDYTQTADGILTIELGGTEPGSGYDQLVVNGSATLDGTLNVSLIDGFVPAEGNQFEILTTASRTGTFAVTSLPELPSYLRWQHENTSEGFMLSVSSDLQKAYLPLIRR